MKTDWNAPARELTKGEWFTGRAMQGLLADHDQMLKFEAAASSAIKQMSKEARGAGKDFDVEEMTRQALDTMIALRAVEIADVVVARLNLNCEDDSPPPPASVGREL